MGMMRNLREIVSRLSKLFDQVEGEWYPAELVSDIAVQSRAFVKEWLGYDPTQLSGSNQVVQIATALDSEAGEAVYLLTAKGQVYEQKHHPVYRLVKETGDYSGSKLTVQSQVYWELVSLTVGKPAAPPEGWATTPEEARKQYATRVDLGGDQ